MPPRGMMSFGVLILNKNAIWPLPYKWDLPDIEVLILNKNAIWQKAKACGATDAEVF